MLLRLCVWNVSSQSTVRPPAGLPLLAHTPRATVCKKRQLLPAAYPFFPRGRPPAGPLAALPMTLCTCSLMLIHMLLMSLPPCSPRVRPPAGLPILLCVCWLLLIHMLLLPPLPCSPRVRPPACPRRVALHHHRRAGAGRVDGELSNTYLTQCVYSIYFLLYGRLRVVLWSCGFTPSQTCRSWGSGW